ncbi:Do family serine endopeptidase [Treponema sp.]|uniref:Do family serine endopeptidase n=1 Tax=Treponema sp. TaxID=166 RepID=UPI003F02D74D
MKNSLKKFVYVSAAAVLALGIFTLSCKVNKGSAAVAFAETPASQIPQDSFAVTQALQNSFRAITSQVLPAVVEVDVKETTKVKTFNPFKDLPFFFGIPQENGDGTKELEQSALGSGVIVRRTGNTIYVLTNNHVIGNATSIKVKLNDEREFEGKLVGKDDRMDIALVSFESSDKSITVAKLGDSDAIHQGDIVLALGSPLGYFASVTQGIVSATGRSGGQIGSISDFIQTDAAINQGNSGGPLVNIYGEVIGINTWIASNSGGSQGLGFSIPINNIKESINQFISKGKITYGWIGISLVEITDEYKEQLGIDKKQQGALASQVFIDGPAYKGGILPGDFITGLNGHDIKSVDQLIREIGGIPAGKTTTIKILRGKTAKEISVKIDERKEDVSANDTKLWPGFIASPLTPEIKKKLNIEDEKVEGIVVARVFEKSPAAALRLQEGNIICAVNGKKVSSLEEFYAALGANSKKEIWYDVYSSGHIVKTNIYEIGK